MYFLLQNEVLSEHISLNRVAGYLTVIASRSTEHAV
jgi:hypothetical protein